MPKRRAFLIAIEHYPQMQAGFAQTLSGTHDAAEQFRNWLKTTHGLEDAHIYFCTENASLPGRTADADLAGIVAELKRLHKECVDQVEELYFFFSGHGFSYVDVDGSRLADVLLASNFQTVNDSGRDACLKLDEVQKWLKVCLGGRDHYYFIDACRNLVTESQSKVAELGLTFSQQAHSMKGPTIYTLYSTTEGATAAAGNVSSGFPGVLLRGLNGTGRAKRWEGANMAVLFDPLAEYVGRSLGEQQAIDLRKDGFRPGLIREFPPTRYTCTMTVQNAAAQDAFNAVISTRGLAVAASFAVTGSGPHISPPLVPDDYLLEMQSSQSGINVEPLDPLPADFYDDCQFRFEKRVNSTARSGSVRAFGASPGGLPVSRLTVRAAAGELVRVVDVTRGDVKAEGQRGTFSLSLAPARYRVEGSDEHGVALGAREVTLASGADEALDLTTMDRTPIRNAILAHLEDSGADHQPGSIDLSETLGPSPDQRLDFWLGVIGAGRILGGHDNGNPHYRKIGRLPLANFEHHPVGSSAAYLLAGFEKPELTFAATIGDDPMAAVVPQAGHPGFPGLYEVIARDLPAGHHYVSVATGQQVPVTFGIVTVPNRVTLVTVTHSTRGSLRIQHLVLSPSHLEGHQGFPMPPVSERLRAVRRIVEIQRAFAKGLELRELLTANELDELLYLKCMEPTVCFLAAYELVRRGTMDKLPMVVGNLRRFYGSLPDVEALAKLGERPDLPWTVPDQPPLVLDGLMAFDLMREKHPRLPRHADFRGPWSIWRGVAGSA
jgi:hypothetical protein